MQHIETVTVGSGGAASITFSAIAADWTDLYIVVSARGEFASDYDVFDVYPNGSSANDTFRVLRGNGSSASSETDAFIRVRYSANNATANTFGNASIYIPNYRASAAKSFSIDAVTENNTTQAFQEITAGLWNVTDPITSITLQSILGEFAQYSSASLFGITAGSDGIVAVS